MAGRHPFKQTPRDTRAHKLIEHYLNNYGVDSGVKETIPMQDHHAANEGRLSVRRGARHFGGLSAAAWVIDQDGEQCIDECRDPRAPHALVFSLSSKERGRAHVYREAGGDPANLKYNPWARRQA
jgi:hypothetical protein